MLRKIFDIKATIITLLEGDDVDFEPLDDEALHLLEIEIGYKLEFLNNNLENLTFDIIEKIRKLLTKKGYL